MRLRSKFFRLQADAEFRAHTHKVRIEKPRKSASFGSISRVIRLARITRDRHFLPMAAVAGAKTAPRFSSGTSVARAAIFRHFDTRSSIANSPRRPRDRARRRNRPERARPIPKRVGYKRRSRQPDQRSISPYLLHGDVLVVIVAIDMHFETTNGRVDNDFRGIRIMIVIVISRLPPHLSIHQSIYCIPVPALVFPVYIAFNICVRRGSDALRLLPRKDRRNCAYPHIEGLQFSRRKLLQP